MLDFDFIDLSDRARARLARAGCRIENYRSGWNDPTLATVRAA